MPIRQDDGAFREDGSPEYQRITSDTAGGRVGTAAGRWFVRSMVPKREIQGHGYEVEPLVEIEPDAGHDPQTRPSVTSDELVGASRAKCARCSGKVSGPSIPGAAYGTIVCAKCARKGSMSDRLMLSMTGVPRGRPPKALAALMAKDGEK